MSLAFLETVAAAVTHSETLWLKLEIWRYCGSTVALCSSVVLCSCVAVWLCVAAPLSLVQLATLFGLLPWGLLLLLSTAPYSPSTAAAAYVNVMLNHWLVCVARCKCCQASLTTKDILSTVFFAAYLQFLHPDFRNKLSQDLYGQMWKSVNL